MINFFFFNFGVNIQQLLFHKIWVKLEPGKWCDAWFGQTQQNNQSKVVYDSQVSSGGIVGQTSTTIEDAAGNKNLYLLFNFKYVYCIIMDILIYIHANTCR